MLSLGPEIQVQASRSSSFRFIVILGHLGRRWLLIVEKRPRLYYLRDRRYQCRQDESQRSHDREFRTRLARFASATLRLIRLLRRVRIRVRLRAVHGSNGCETLLVWNVARLSALPDGRGVGSLVGGGVCSSRDGVEKTRLEFKERK